MRFATVFVGTTLALLGSLPADAQWLRQRQLGRQIQPNFRPQFQPQRPPNMSVPMTYARPQRSTNFYYQNVAPRAYQAQRYYQQNPVTRETIINGGKKIYNIYGAVNTAKNGANCLASLPTGELALIACGSAAYSGVIGPKIVNPYVKSYIQQQKQAWRNLPATLSNGYNINRAPAGWIWGNLFGM